MNSSAASGLPTLIPSTRGCTVQYQSGRLIPASGASQATSAAASSASSGG